MRRLLPHVQAGLCVGVLACWLGSVGVTLMENGVVYLSTFRSHAALLTAFGLLLGICFGLFVGYRERAVGVGALVVRALASIGFGAVLGYALAVVCIVVAHVALGDGSEALLPWTGPLGAVTLLGLLGLVHGLRSATSRGRALRLVATFGVAFVSAWPLWSGLRCTLGSGEGCRHRGMELHVAGKDAQAVDALARACGRGDGEGCVRLATQLDFGIGVERDSQRAEGLIKRACQDQELCYGNFQSLWLSLDDLRLEATLLYDRKRPEPVPGCRDAQVIRDCLDVSSAACLAIAAARRHSCGYYSGSPTELQELRDLYARTCRMGSKEACSLAATLRPTTTRSGKAAGSSSARATARCRHS